MRSRISLVLIIVAFIVLTLLSSAYFYRGDLGAELDPSRSTYSNRPGGYKALYLTLDRLGLPVERWRRSPAELDRSDDTLVITSLRSAEEISTEDSDRLREWVVRGGHLILIGDRFTVGGGGVGMGLDEQLKTTILIGPSGFADGSSAVQPVVPSPFANGVAGLEVGGSSRVDDSDPGVVVHVADPEGPICTSARHGQGRVVVVSDSRMGSNEMISEADNLRFLLNILLSEWQAGKILFDEYHHGFRDEERFLGYLARSPWGAVAFQVVFLGCIWLVGLGRRFGPLLPLPPRGRSSSMEHVDSVSSLYESARACGLCLTDIYRGFRREAVRLCGLPASATTEEVGTAYAAKYGLKEKDLRHLLLRCEQRIRRGRMSAKELLRLSRALARCRVRR